MDQLATFFQRARDAGKSVVLPEGGDARVIAAARRLCDQQLAQPIVLGPLDQLQRAAAEAVTTLDGINCIDPANDPRLPELTAAYQQQRQVREGIARRMVKRSLFFGGMMVATGRADAMVAGVAHATATVIQAGALTVGLADGIETPSSFFLMVLPQAADEPGRCLVFADCAVTVDPTGGQLADIALASYASAAKLLDQSPRVALLSFATHGSASHRLVDKVVEAVSIVRQRNPAAPIDGEFQADAALVPSVAAKKVKQPSDVAGQANVLVFPDLNSGNISYKLTQYLAHAQAIGPFLQGFAKPISDLSRGASCDDIVATTAIVLALS